MTRRRRAAAALGLALLTACAGTDGEGDAGPPDLTQFTFFVPFYDEKTLPEIEAMAKDLDGEVVALWSYNMACVANVDGNGPQPSSKPDSPPAMPKRRSSFAYYKADELVAKQQLGPPATDLGWSQSLRARFVEEWTAAKKPGVEFAAAVFHAQRQPEDAVEIESYLTDEVQVRYLRGHEHALDEHITGGLGDKEPC